MFNMKSKGIFKYLSLLVLMLLLSVPAMARDWDSDWSARWDPASGCIVIDVAIWWDGTGTSVESGFCDDGHAELNIPGIGKIGLNCGSAWPIENAAGMNPYIYNRDHKRRAQIYVPIQPSQLGTQITLQLSGVWWERGAAKDDDVNESRNVFIDNSATDFTITTPTPEANYTIKDGKPMIKIHWKRQGSQQKLDPYGWIYLCDAAGNHIAGVSAQSASNRSGDFYVPVTKELLDDYHDYKVVHEFTPSYGNFNFKKSSSPITVNAYPQVETAKTVFNETDLLLNIEWTIASAPSSKYIKDDFSIIIFKYSSDGKILLNKDTVTVPYAGGKSSYVYDYELDEDEESQYVCTIMRNNPDAKNLAQKFEIQTEPISINSKHVRPINPVVKFDMVSKTDTVKWTVDGDIWSKGTRFSIFRINSTQSTSEEIVLTKDVFFSGKFVDDLLRPCNEYYYKLSINPNDKYNNPPTVSTSTVKYAEIGNISNFHADKGYYSDRITMNWHTEGAFDRYYIERRELNNANSDFEQIAGVQATGSSATLYYTDETAMPTILYQYRIFGSVNCDGDFYQSDTLTDNGFRTPTGDFYGKVTFESGQGVDSVMVHAETTTDILEKSIYFNGSQSATISDNSLLANNREITIQVWISPSQLSGNEVILSKEGRYTLKLVDGVPAFVVGNMTLKPDNYQLYPEYTHLTATFGNGKMRIYIDGDMVAEQNCNSVPPANNNYVKLGEGFAGNIDELRIYDTVLDDNEISKGYKCYIIGDEKGLVAYYNFNFSSERDFFDLSFHSAVYNRNDGVLSDDDMVSEVVPSHDQLWYRTYTKPDGTYSLRGLPYIGNGTAWTIIPTFGIHSFSPTSEIRFLSSSSTNYTVNFTDKSAFQVTGTVLYEGGTYPVEGAYFTIDGVTATKSNGSFIYTDADGKFDILVPVGTHEVKVLKGGHTFQNDGRITNSDGTDRNYQDILSGLELIDQTKVKYIGRVAGGTVQEAFPVGHSLSTNNLANNITIKLTHTKPQFKLDDSPSGTLVKERHFLPSNKTKAHYNDVLYKTDGMVISVNDTTGEFVAYVIPEKFTVDVNVNGYSDIPGSGSEINFNDVVLSNMAEVYKCPVVNGKDTTLVSDSVYYNKMQKFIKRVTPTVHVAQMHGVKEYEYFGDDTIKNSDLFGNVTKLALYNDQTKEYYFGSPVFQQFKQYEFGVKVYEEYVHTDTRVSEKVPTQDAEANLIINFADGEKDVTFELDSTGFGSYQFRVGEPEFTTATSSMSAKITYGKSDSKTSIDWDCPFAVTQGMDKVNKVFVVGQHIKGTDFVTAGPNKVLTVLRDPPGSNSYSYLEKGVTFSSSSKYTGSIENEGTDSGVQEIGTDITILSGSPFAMTKQTTKATSTTKVGVNHSEQYEGSDAKSTSTTITTRFQTSDDPEYVGADGDTYIGYSTNISFGSSDVVSLVKKSTYNANPSAYGAVYTDTDKDYLLVKSEGTTLTESFNTLFIYPQIHIEEVLIPGLEELKSKLLIPYDASKVAQYQKVANEKDTVFYLSYLSEDDENYGKSNSSFKTTEYNTKLYDGYSNGPSYMIIKKNDHKFSGRFENAKDTINIINQWIQAWKDRIKDNEKAKVKATLLQNYSFHAGSNVEYSESYSTTRSHTSTFHITLGVKVEQEADIEAAAGAVARTSLAFEETGTTTQGGEFESEAERSHSKGFVLAEEGSDYLSVDVCREPNWTKESEEYDHTQSGGMVDSTDVTDKTYFSSFIFKTKAGMTSCPYEGERVTKYYDPGTVLDKATLKLEVPQIDVADDFVEFVPSGESAYITLYMRNNSEANADAWYNLYLVSETNPYGAVLSIDGSTFSGDMLSFLVPAGGTLTKTLEVKRGRVLNYDNLKVVLASQCQNDPTGNHPVIADTATFSVHFTPSCTNVEILEPSDKWTYNTVLPADTIDGIAEHYIMVALSNFDVNYDDFDHIELQYKRSNQNDNEWATLKYYYHDNDLYYNALKNGFNAEMIDAPTLKYKFYMDDYIDQNYDLRAVTYCNINNVYYTNESPVVSGLKDMYNPRLYGQAQPADGILSIGDDIMVTFNEPINGGLVTQNNISVTGVRNGSVTTHSTSVYLDGKSSYMATEFDRNLGNKDFTVEFFMKTNVDQNAVLFSHGEQGNSVELSITSDNYLVLNVNGKTVKTAKPIALDKGTWSHVAFSISKTGIANIYYNFEAVAANKKVGAYTGRGSVNVGRSISSKADFFDGYIHDLRIWNILRRTGELQINSEITLSGSETGIFAYYPMTEGKGEVVNDKARSVNMQLVNCKWALPAGHALSFDGKGYAKLNSGSAVVDTTGDFAVEFWFKTNGSQSNATIIGNGAGNGSDFGGSRGNFNVAFDNAGQLVVNHNGFAKNVNGHFDDSNWHHFAYTVSRSIGRAQIYIDGELNTYFDADKAGGIMAANIVAGARCVQANALKEVVDQYFNGCVDEVRVWNLYRNQKLIENFNNEKMSGTETGLLLYYPFETYIDWQGTKELQPSNDDFASDETKCVATLEGGASFTDDIAPVKDAGAVSKLNYEYVVSNDGIVINLNEADERIEKIIVTFTISEIYDANGNPMVSPVTWTAYIDRNQLKWDEELIELTKADGDPLEFATTIHNNGGVFTDYEILQLPEWLSVDLPTGTLSPSSSQKVKFTVNDGINVGVYNENIYLKNKNTSVAEILDLSLVVTGDEPEWTVNPGDYTNTMSIMGKLMFNGIFSADKRDIIAAFRNDTCVGVANSVYNADVDMWYVMLPVYSNLANDQELSFKLYDASTGKTYLAETKDPIYFVKDAVIGSPSEPVIFSGDNIIFNHVRLSKNWNWVSFNLTTPNPMTNSVLGTVGWNNTEIIKNRQSHASYSMNQKKWNGTLSTIDNTSMFMVKAADEKIFSYCGYIINPKNVKITLKPGVWNYISYIPTSKLPLETALAGYDPSDGDIVKSIDKFAIYYRNNWVGSLEYMTPNQGYMLYINANQDKTLSYPSVTSGLSKRALVEKEYRIAGADYAQNMNIIATADCEGKFSANAGGRSINATEIEVDGKKLLLFTVGGDEKSGHVTFTKNDGFGTETSSTVIRYRSDAVAGSIDNPLVLDFGGSIAANAQNVGIVESKVSPNPFSDMFYVKTIAAVGGTLQIVVTDIMGRTVAQAPEAKVQAGEAYTAEFLTSDWKSGIYIVKTIIDSQVYTQKVIKK